MSAEELKEGVPRVATDGMFPVQAPRSLDPSERNPGGASAECGSNEPGTRRQGDRRVHTHSTTEVLAHANTVRGHQ